MWSKIRRVLFHKRQKHGKVTYKILGIPVWGSRVSKIFYSVWMGYSLKRNPKQAIVMIDGGICSQIHQWRIGEALSQKGVSVEYDISWFDDYGMDINGKFVRNFDLLKAFPELTFKRASLKKISYFKKHFSYHEPKDGLFINTDMPKYLGGYYPSYYKSLLPFSYTISTSVLDEASKKIATDIKNMAHPIGVHVRRGDMSISQHNWKVCPVSYFVNAVDYFINKYSDAAFYFFSDEPEWVTDNIIPCLKKWNNKFCIVSHNGSDKGYMDLALLSYCQHFIASQGSFAHYANMLNHSSDKILIVPEVLGEEKIKEIHNLNEVNPRPIIG